LLSLPVRQPIFLAMLQREGVLSGNIERIKAYPTETESAQYLVGKIHKSLRITRNEFDKLLLVMKEYKYGGMEELAQQIENDLEIQQTGSFLYAKLCTYGCNVSSYMWWIFTVNHIAKS